MNFPNLPPLVLGKSYRGDVIVNEVPAIVYFDYLDIKYKPGRYYFNVTTALTSADVVGTKHGIDSEKAVDYAAHTLKLTALPTTDWKLLRGTPLSTFDDRFKRADRDIHILKRSTKHRMGFVYFIAPQQGGPIKIGWALWPPARLAELQVGSPLLLKILGVIPGKLIDEGALHRRFFHLLLHGEWFDATRELLAFVRKHAVPWNNTR